MAKNIKHLNYKITGEVVENTGYEVPNSLQPELEKIYHSLQNPKSKTIGRLKKLITKYPNVVQLKNYLAVAYEHRGEPEKAEAVNDLLLEEHPDYFFAKSNKAGQYIEQEQYDKAAELLGPTFDLKELYPHRDTFHIQEFMTMQHLAVQYFAGIDDIEQMEMRLNMMEEVNPDSFEYEEAQRIVMLKHIFRAGERHKKELEKIISPVHDFKPDDSLKPGKFHFQETQDLYQFDLDIDPDILDNYKALDRDKVISDLENIIKKSFFDERKDIYCEVIHALFLLGDLEAEESLPLILEMMKQDENYFEEAFGEIFHDAWITLFKIGRNQTDLLEDYLKTPGLYLYFRYPALETLVQIYHHDQERREEILSIFNRLLDFFLNAEIEDNVVDSEFIGFFITDLVDMQQDQFLPEIKKLYQKEYVAESVSGDYESVEKDIINPRDDSYSLRKKLWSTNEYYKEFDSQPFQPFFPTRQNLFSESNPSGNFNSDHIIKKDKKVGRNDPCPCGSGKKFKKCCINKGIYD